MRVLDGGLDLDLFFRSVREAKSPALMIDYDGTLAPFVVDRDRAYPYPGVRDKVESLLGGSGTRLVVISGRAASDIPKLLGTSRTPEIWGSHGWERMMPDGSLISAKLGDRERDAVNRAAGWAKGLGCPERLEVKPAGAAFHLRGLDGEDSDRLRDEALIIFEGIASGTGFEIHEFDGGVEMRLAGRNKGDAVETLIGELPPGSPAAYLGDDATDEDAFGAIQGRGLGVLVRPEFRDTRAGLWLRPPGELIWFLDKWLDTTTGRR